MGLAIPERVIIDPSLFRSSLKTTNILRKDNESIKKHIGHPSYTQDIFIIILHC